MLVIPIVFIKTNFNPKTVFDLLNKSKSSFTIEKKNIKKLNKVINVKKNRKKDENKDKNEIN